MSNYIDIQGVMLKKLMGLSGLSEGALAEKVDSNRTTLNNYVNSNRIDPELLRRIESIVGVSLDNLTTFLQKGRIESKVKDHLNEGQDINKLREERDSYKDKLLHQHERYEKLEEKYDELEKKYKELINKKNVA